jgi:ADP-ribose pyrophosphatase
MKIRRWQTVREELLVSTPVFDLERRRAIHQERGERDFYVLKPPTWVNIIPLTRSEDVVLVRQWRHGIGAFTLEIPGGMMDPDDPSPRAAARREMLEESGYDSRRISALGSVHPNPAIQPNVCHSFLARDVHPVSAPCFDGGGEEATVVTVPLTDIDRLIRSGKITHALVIAAFALFGMKRRGSPPI